MRNVQQFRGGLVFKAHRLCVSLNSGLESNKEGEAGTGEYRDDLVRELEFGHALAHLVKSLRFKVRVWV